MLKIILEGHDNYYGIGDVVRLFYGPCREDRENNAVLCDLGPDMTLISAADASCSLPINRQVKRDLYEKLAQITGISLPWGCLTGIRPTIVAQEEGFDPDALVSKYFVREDKARLACDTARLESEIARSAREKLNVYAGVPFCPGRCEYCSFIAQDATHHLNRLHDYAGAMITEMNELAPFINETPGTIYMGGGTPTVFDEEDMRAVLECIAKTFRAGEGTEFTVEAGRPDTITEGKLIAMRDNKVSRICINPQTMRDETLRMINRRHTADDVVKTFELARRTGFDVINMDLIAGLKYETADDFLYSVKTLADLDPENITIHTLYKKRRAGMSREDVLNAEGRGDVDKAVREAYELLTARGYVPYYMYRQKDTELGLENTGFCKPGTHNIYNVAMMSYECDVLSVGAGAMSKRAFKDGRYERCPNVKDVSLYMNECEKSAEKKISFFDLRRRNGH
ncbi:MAG: coproporphyrinogen dehydrogenase HemZ [Clostridiales bacterium]|nr:coproporphyrinogen dehydrogenase HemZ [Clostridiales bacterium]